MSFLSIYCVRLLISIANRCYISNVNSVFNLMWIVHQLVAITFLSLNPVLVGGLNQITI